MATNAVLPPMPLPDTHLLLAYIADLELEIDRLRKHGQFIQQQVRDVLKRVHALTVEHKASSDAASVLEVIGQDVAQLREMMRDLQELPGYHPAHDQVIAIAVRPLIEQIFRWQQRLEQARDTTLQLELGSEHVDWFPARLRHILDNLVSNALKYRDPAKKEPWVRVRLQVLPDGYEFAVSDNGIGLSLREKNEFFGLLYRAAPARAAGLGLGLAVVKLLVEQSGGVLTAESERGQGCTVLAVLPRYEVDDFLT